MTRKLRGKFLVRKGKTEDGKETLLTLTGIFRPMNFSVDDVNGNDEMWVADIVVEEGGIRFTDSVHTTHSACSPEEFLAGVHQLPSDFKNKTIL